MSDCKVSKKYIGDVQALERKEVSGELMLYGLGGYIQKFTDCDVYEATITKDGYKLATPNFCDLERGPQTIQVSESGLKAMIQYLKVPADPRKQLRLFRYAKSLEKSALKMTKKAPASTLVA